MLATVVVAAAAAAVLQVAAHVVAVVEVVLVAVAFEGYLVESHPHCTFSCYSTAYHSVASPMVLNCH